MKYTGVELLEKLSMLFGPSGCEGEVAEFIVDQIQGDCDSIETDRVGNIIARISGRGIEYNPESPKKVMVCAHMDEVGVMVSDITEEGYLRFSTVGGISPTVLLDKKVILLCENGKKINGVISSKAIHMQTVEERGKVIPTSKMYIDIGASSEAEARQYVEIGTVGVFDSDFVLFGEADNLIKGKALDDRLGCAIMIDIMRELYTNGKGLEYDVYFAFTCCEEIGISGATVAANKIRPDVAIVLESTAVADIAGVPAASKVAILGEGGAISLMDRSTIYDRNTVEIALAAAENYGIKAQIKKYISGGNDSANIQRSGKGVKVLSLSAPSRYIHSASNVIHREDVDAMRSLTYTLIANGKI
ncbi:MAG: M42 family metallopeptidase [Ruminococcaceae bacterium]|nr:M42 family metallopeptidase [Oscillospiraceae bacterium]